MSKSQGWIFVLGIVVGHISGYLTADNKSMDTDQLTSIIRTELQDTMSRQPTSQFFSETPITNETKVLFTDDGKQRFINDLKESLRDAVQEIVREEVSSQRSTVALEDSNIRPNQEQTQAAVIESQELLTSAIARGSWTSEDIQNYDNALQKLSGNELADAYRQLSAAINNGEISPDSDSVVH